MPTISVIVPVYKVEPYLRRCVDSILAQTFTDFELILVDDGSPDGCPAICDEYAKKDDRIVVIHQENGGLSAARNAGIDWSFANSNSEWLSFIDSDDWVHPCFLEYLYRAAIENEVQMSACLLTLDQEELTNVRCMTTPLILSIEEFYASKIISNSFFVNSSCLKLYHKDIFTTIRFPVGKLYEDVFTSPQLLWKAKKLSYLDFPLYYYFTQNDSLTRTPYSEKNFDQLHACEWHCTFFKNKNRKLFLLAIQRCILTYSSHWLLANETPLFQKYAKKLRYKIRRMLIRYRLQKILPLEKNKWVYEIAFPTGMKAYWLWLALLYKLKLKSKKQ